MAYMIIMINDNNDKFGNCLNSFNSITPTFKKPVFNRALTTFNASSSLREG